MSRILIHNAIIVNEGEQFSGYLIIEDSRIAHIGRGGDFHPVISGAQTASAAGFNIENRATSESFGRFDRVIDAEGGFLLPGAIDTHVHFREPGLTHKASIATESAAAVSGGVTSFLDMPNTKPATTSMSPVRDKKRIAADTSYCNYGFFLGATNDNLDEILAADPCEIPGVKLFMGSSTGNMLVDDDLQLSDLFARYKGIIAVHAEDEPTLRAARERLTAELGDEIDVWHHAEARPSEACVIATRRAVEMARRHGTRLHVCHVSTREELQFFSPGNIGDKKITAETCPHYLLFTSDDLKGADGCMLKCNPAIKSADDRAALRDAVADGTIDVIATDHAPHLIAEKQGSLFKAASGMPGTRFMLSAMLTLAPKLGITPARVAELCSHNPARLYGIAGRGFIRQGYYADLVIVAPCEAYHPDAGSYLPKGLMSPCDWTPYARTELTWRVAATMVNGCVAYDGTRVRATVAMPLEFSRSSR